MAATPSNMVPLGMKAPDFMLLETQSGKHLFLKEMVSGKPFVVMFLCNHCPFVLHVNEELVLLANEYMPRGIAFLAISSNDVLAYPQDGPDQMKNHAEKLHYPFPYLYDHTQEVAKAYDAACTPDFYLFSKDKKLVYRGQLDDSRPSNSFPVTGKDLRNAIDLFLDVGKISSIQNPSIGCSIKWKKD